MYSDVNEPEQVNYTQEQWIKWEPIIGLHNKYDVDNIADNLEGLIITLYSCNEENHKVEVAFKPYADSYRHTNESFRIKLPHELAEKYGRDILGWTFFKVIDSEYLAWMSDESCEWSERFEFQHFSLLCSDSVVDIISQYEPTVKIYEV